MKYFNPVIISISLLFLIHSVSPSKILVLTFFSSRSHKITYMRLIEELASRGHQITIVTPVKSSKVIPNIKEIFTMETEHFMDPFKIKEKGETLNPFSIMGKIADLCRKSFEMQKVQDLLKEKYDLIFMQPLFNECALGLAYRLQAPLIFFAPTTIPATLAGKTGNYFPPSFVPNIMLGYSDEMDFKQRFISYGFNLVFEGIVNFYWQPTMTSVYREYLGQDIPSVGEILGNASLTLSNGHFSLSGAKPYLPNIIDVGGIHSGPAKPLPKDLEEFVTKGKNGFILFSMGSAIKGDTMTEEKRKMFLQAFSRLKQQVLWKWESETMPNLPKNVKLSKWLPQEDLLGHKDIKMFITHCGGGSTDEAIYHGVPLIGLPMYGDQNLNSNQAKNRGFLYQLEWNELTEEKIYEGIQEVLNNPRYKQNAQKLSTLFRDQPDDPLQRGVYWVEYVIRHKGAPQLKTPARNLYSFQYHSYDVMAAYLAIIYGILKLLGFILKSIGRICGIGGSKNKSHLSVKKNK